MLPDRLRRRVSALSGATSAFVTEGPQIDADGEQACIVSTRGAWSRSFLVWMAMLDAPIEVLGPPELADIARTLVARLQAATP